MAMQLPTITVPYPGDPEPQQVTPDNGVSIASPAQDPDTGVSLASPMAAPVTLPTPVIQERAKKIQEGIGEHLQKSTEEIAQDIQNGKEDTLRYTAAASLNVEKQQRLRQSIVDLANSKGGPLDEDEVNRVMDPFNPANKPVDPQSVVEVQYGTKYISSIQQAIDAVPNNPVQTAQAEVPEAVNESFLKGSELTAKMEGFRKIREGLEAQLSKQSYIGRAADEVKQMFQPYNEYKLRGNTPDVGGLTGGLGLGTNMTTQADHIFSLPLDQSLKVAQDIADKLSVDNPSLAHRFISYLEGLPASDRILDNTFTAIAPLDYIGVGKGAINVGRKISLYNRTNTAVKQFVRVADQIGTDASARAEVAGDVGTAAQKRSTGIVMQDINGTSDPTKIATDETLLTFLNQDKEKLGTDIGSLRREQVTRIQDQYDASGQTLLQRILDATRINRIPMALATENAVKIVKDAVKDYYPGIRNAILDISNPLYEPKSNTYWHDITFGNIGGDLFSNPETAKNFAEMHGLDADIVESFGRVTPKEIQQQLTRKAFVDKTIPDIEQTIQRRKGEMNNTKLSAADRQTAKEQAEGLQTHLDQFKKESSDLDLRMKGKETYDRVQRLEGEIGQFRAIQKDLNKTTSGNPDHIQAAIDFGKEQIKLKAQEINAIKQSRASVIAPRDTVEQHGVGFKIVVRRPLVETDRAIRDLMIRDASGKLIPEAISTSSATGFKSLMNAAIGKFRGSEDTLALNESIQRKIGTYTQTLFKEWAYQEAKYIKQIASGVVRTDPVTGESIPYWKAKISAVADKLTPVRDKEGKLTNVQNKRYNEFVRTLDYARDAKDPISGKPGYFFETPGQLDNHYDLNYGRLPSFAEHEGYFAFVRMVEGDRIMRELAEFRNRARLGTEQFSISARGPDGKNVKSAFFDGIAMKHFPGGDDVLMVMQKKLGEEKLYNLGGSALQGKTLEGYRKAVEQGTLKVIRVYAPEFKPLRDFSDVAGNEHVRYILTDAHESKPIEFNHVNRRGGGHFEYDYDNFLKQANMYHQYESGVKGRYKSVYTGDTTFMPVLNRVMGGDIADKLHAVQKYLREGDIEGAKQYTIQHLPIEWDQLHSMFKPGRDAAGKVTAPSLDLNEPFVVVPKGKTVNDMSSGLKDRYGTAFKDGTRSGSDNRQFAVAFNTERESSGLTHLEDVGTQGNPLYKYSPDGKMIDPITTMNRSLNRIVNTVFMDDYKMYAVEHWLREAEGHLTEVNAELARSSPFYMFQSASDKSAFKSGTSWEQVSNLLSNRYKINQFIGMPSTFDTAIRSATQWLVDTAYNKFGPEGSRNIVQKAVTVLPLAVLGRIHDPVTFMRSMTFHFKLGIFNPAQFLVQAQTFAAIAAISPRAAVSGTLHAFLHEWGRINPSMIETLSRYAEKLGTRPGEFKEAWDTLKKTGFEQVAGEYGNLNTALKTDFVGNDFKNLLHAGTVFFSEGEKSTRLGAWYTAFKEFRDVNPTGAISKTDIGKILQRADLLTINMSRASASSLHSGVMSLTTQFVTYQLRQAELFMGKRLGDTLYERNMARFRLLTFYSALYGAPASIGLTGLPFSNSIREEAIKRGYVVGDNWLTSAIDQGLPAMFAAMVTGGGDWKKGNNYNFGDRFGAPGFTQFNDALKSDHAWYQLLAGASGGVLTNTLSNTGSFFHAMAAMAFRPNGEKPFKFKSDDFVSIFKEISTVNQIWKLIAAINYGKWMSKNEAYVGDVTKANAAFMATFGVNPQQQDDSYLKQNIKKEEIAFQKESMALAIKDYRRGILAAKDQNPQQAADFMKNAFTRLELAGFPADKKATFLAIASKGYESQIKQEDWDFAFKNVPSTRSDVMGVPMPFNTQSGQERTRQEQFRTQQQINQYKDQK